MQIWKGEGRPASFAFPVNERALKEKSNDDVTKTKFRKLWDSLVKPERKRWKVSLLVQIGGEI